MPETEFRDLEVPEIATDPEVNGHREDKPDDDTPEVEEGVSPLSTLKDRYKALQGKHTKDIDVPGYAGALVGRYKPLDEDTYKALRKKINRMPEEERELTSMIDQLIEACESLWCRAEDGDLVPLSEDGSPVRYGDDRLAEVLGFEPSKLTRGNVRKVFSTDDGLNVAALRDHSIDVGIWMADVSSEVDDTLGEA